jgi:plastocyanin
MTLLRSLLVITALVLLAPSTPSRAASGTIRGRVDVRVAAGSTDRRPDISGLTMPANQNTVDRGRSVVYLETAPRGAFDAREEPHAEMDQRNETFIPHVLAIVAGTWVDFPNDDRTYHNVFSLSKAKQFDLGRYATGKSKAVRFDRPGIVRVFCDIHSHMSAFILVFAHRYFTVTDDDGRYHLDNVPPGSYTLAVWNETVKGDFPRKTIAIPDSGGAVDADFTIR